MLQVAVVPPGLATLLDISSSSTTSGSAATSTANIPLCEVVAVLAAVVPLLGMTNKDASPGGGSTAVSAAKRPLCWVLAAALLAVVPPVPAVVPPVLAVVPLLR